MERAEVGDESRKGKRPRYRGIAVSRYHGMNEPVAEVRMILR